MGDYSQEVRISKRLREIFPTTSEEFTAGDINAVWEDKKCIHLLWCDKQEVEKHHFTFGKRARFYYRCPYNCPCFCETLRWLFLGDSVNFKKNRPAFFEGKETVVVEEKRASIDFYSKLNNDVRKERLSFSISEGGDRGIKCSDSHKRLCADNPRVSYTTFRQISTDSLFFLSMKGIPSRTTFNDRSSRSHSPRE